MLAERRRESGETQGERRDTGREERHKESGETQGERRDTGRAERCRERGETQGEQRDAGPAGTAAERQIHRTYTGRSVCDTPRPSLRHPWPHATSVLQKIKKSFII